MCLPHGEDSVELRATQHRILAHAKPRKDSSESLWQVHVKSAAIRKGSEGRSVRARMVRVRVRVREQVSAPGPPQASVATRTGWDSASVQVREADRRRALGWARRR